MSMYLSPGLSGVFSYGVVGLVTHYVPGGRHSRTIGTAAVRKTLP